MSVRTSRDAGTVGADDVEPFFGGWPTKPSSEQILAALRGADEVDLSCDDDAVPFSQGLGFERVNAMVIRRPGVLG